nr:reverse transcriptase domain-containing protein [Tanacetum cinerariifolium]
MDPYEEVAQQGQVHPLSPAYIPDPMELDEHVPVHVLEPEQPEYHTPSDEDIQDEDDNEDLEEDPTRISVKSQTPMAASTQALIDALATRSSPFLLPPTSPVYDRTPLDHMTAMIHMREDIPEEDMPPRRRFALTAPPPGCDIAESSAAARAPRSQYDFINDVKAGQGLRMMTSIEEVNLRVSYQAQVRRQETKIMPVTKQGTNDAMTPESIQAMIDWQSKKLYPYSGRCKPMFGWRTQKTRATAHDETEKVDKYISGLLDNIHGNVMSARPKTLDETIELDNDVMDQKLRTYAERQNENKRKTDNNQQQQPYKKQNVARVYTAGPGEKKVYTGDLPLCTKCNYHHTGQCKPRCGKCKRYGHTTMDCQANTNNNNNNKNQKARACYKCGNTGHIKRNCLKLNNRKNGIAQGRAYVLGGRDASPDSSVIMDTFLLNNRYAKILFNTGADRSFVSATFSALIDITPTTLENYYDVELADEKIIGVNTIVRGCTLNFMNHPFSIDLMPIPLGSFDVIIGIDWLTNYHGVIICDEKIVCVPFGREMLIIQGNRDNQREESPLNIISCTKAQEYLEKGCDIFLAHITAKEAKDKLEGKRLEDVPIVKDFPEIFPEDLLGIPPARQGNRDNQREESPLNIISCTKAQEYLEKGCDIFLAHITAKEAKDKLEGKRLEDVPIVKDFPEIFPEDLLGIPPARQV